MRMNQYKHLTLYQLCTLIQTTIDSVFSNDYYWITAEILSLQVRLGHCYLSLIEKNQEGTEPVVEIKGIIWKNNYERINAKFKNITGFDLKPDIKVLLLVGVRYSPRYGLNLYIYDIQGEYTLGQMYLDRKKTIEELQRLGILENNKKIPLPLVPQRIAILSSLDSKGFEDFITTLKNNKFGYQFYVKLFPVVLQGPNVGPSITRRIAEIHQKYQGQFDVIAILRGGGGNVDLTGFNNLELAKAICLSTIPVITGIGHTTDISVADEVAAIPCQTPTAAASWIINQFFAFEKFLSSYSQNLAYYTQHYLVEQQQNVEHLTFQLKQVIRSFLDAEAQQTETYSQKIAWQTIQYLRHEQNWIIETFQTIRHVSSRLFQHHFSRIQQYILTLQHKLQHIFLHENTHLQHVNTLIRTFIKSYLLQQEQWIGHIGKLIEAYNPRNILKKGFTISKQNNKIITTAEQINSSIPLQTIFKDGTVISEIQEINKTTDI